MKLISERIGRKDTWEIWFNNKVLESFESYNDAKKTLQHYADSGMVGIYYINEVKADTCLYKFDIGK